MSGNLQWLRYVRLVVGPKSGGQGLDLSQFRVVFRVMAPIVSTPNALWCRVYNLAKDTVEQLRAYNPTPAAPLSTGPGQSSGQVILDAGYINGQQGNIFQGDIVQVRAGRINQVDTYTDIYARDSDYAYIYGVVNTTLAAGYTPQDAANAAAQAYSPYGVTNGQLPSSVPQTGAPRGKAMFGMARDHLDDLATTYELTWSADRGQLVYISYRDLRQGQAIVLNSRTGLIGMPQLTENGVTARCLLNPAINWGTRVQINNSDIQLPQYQIEGTALNYVPGLNSIAAGGDGVYKVLQAEHFGDTRGNDWYTDFTCLSVDNTMIPIRAPQMGIPP